MYGQIRALYEAKLWTNLSALGGLILPTCTHSEDFITPHQDIEIQLMFADAFLKTKEYRRAEKTFKEALQCKKHYLKLKGGGGSEDDFLMTDVEIKYKMHVCYLKTSQAAAAFNILQSIPAKQRTPRVNMSLAQLYYQAGMERPAITCYKEVLKACPLAFEAAQILLQLGVKAKEIQGLTLDLNPSVSNGLEWFNPWIQATAHFANRDYNSSIAIYRSIEEKYHPFRDNVHLLVSIGQAQFYNGDFTGATFTLSRAHKIEPFYLKGMDILASLLAKEKKTKDLEVLAKKLLSISEDFPEPWTAMGYHSYLNKKGTRAVYFAHKACLLQNKSIEALLLKGNLLLELKKPHDAINHFREAIQLAPHRYECHKGLVECYLGQSRFREAVTIAAAANRVLNATPRVLTLYASVLVHDPLQISISKSKGLLERALQADPCYLPAVYRLAELLEQEMNFDEAIALLRKQLTLQTTCRLHQMLADLLAKTNEEEKAMEHYGIALNLDPKNLPAQEGLQKIEQATDTPLDTTYDLEMEEINSDDADLEESETEAVWSDGDLNITSSSAARGLN